jgi:hypothetical protein
MNGYVYQPRASVYSLAHDVLLGARQASGRPLTRKQAERQLKVTPGLMFAPGVTLDEVLKTLESWRLLRIKGNSIEVLSW